jgi:hypothetical protein
MLEGLSAIPWAELDHAYGSAEEVPLWLRQLAAEDAGVRDRAMRQLENCLEHQGTLWPATAAAVPFLVELLQEQGIQVKAQILPLLAANASGASQWLEYVASIPPHEARGAGARLSR